MVWENVLINSTYQIHCMNGGAATRGIQTRMRHITLKLKIHADIEKIFAISTDYNNLYKVTDGFYTLSKIRSSRDNAMQHLSPTEYSF